MKTPASLLLLVIALASCSKIHDHGEPPVIDWPTYGYMTAWEETGIRKGTSDWKAVPEGNSLRIWSDYADSINPRISYYAYPQNGPIPEIDSTGYLIQKDHLMTFLSKKQPRLLESFQSFRDESGEAKVVRFKIHGDTLLIRDTVAVPAVEIRYRKG